MKRFIFKQLALVLTIAMLMPLIGIAEDPLLNEAVSLDGDIVVATETEEGPEEIGDLELPGDEDTSGEDVSTGDDPDETLPGNNVIPTNPDEDLTGENDASTEDDDTLQDAVEAPAEPVNEQPIEGDTGEDTNVTSDGETPAPTEDVQNDEPQDQAENTDSVNDEGDNHPDVNEPEDGLTESEATVTDQVVAAESIVEEAASVVPAEEQVLTDEIQVDESEQSKLVAAGPAIPAALTMGLKEKYQLTGGSGYTSSNPKVATVSASGLIIAKKKGSTTINAGVAICQVTVKAAPKKVKLPKKQTVIAGQSIILVAKVSGGASANITWSSSNPSVATVDANGMVTGISMGKAKIIAKTYNKKKATCTVTVESANAPTMVSFPMGTLFVGKGESVQLKPMLNPGAETKFTYTSKNKKVASVNKTSGVLKGKKVKKSTKITVTTHNKKKAILTVKVMKAPNGVTLNIPAATLDVGGAVVLTASLSAKTASQVYWSSDNPGVATVSDASPFSDGTISAITVTAVGAGTATITARTFNVKTASCTITVNAPPAPASGGGETNNNNNDNTGNTPSTPEIAEPAIDPIADTSPAQGSPVVIKITNAVSGQSYMAGVYSIVNGAETLVKEYGLDATGNTITIPTEELSMGDYKVCVTTTSADGSTSKSVDAGEITVKQSDELLKPSVTIGNTTPKQGAVLAINIKNADQGREETYKAVVNAGEYTEEFGASEGNKVIEIDTTGIPAGRYSLSVVVSANGDSKQTDLGEITIRPAALNDISCTLSMDDSALASGSTIPQGKTVMVGINHVGQDLGETYTIKLSGSGSETTYDASSKSYEIDTAELALGTYNVSATVSATDYDSKASDALSFTVAALAVPTLTLNSSTVTKGTPVVVTVSGDQPIAVQYEASIVNVADESNTATGTWNDAGTELTIDTTDLIAGATYKVSVTVSETGNEGYASKIAEATFMIPGLEAPAVTITKAAIKQGGALEAIITNNNDQPTAVTYSAQIKTAESDIIAVPCTMNETSLSFSTNTGTDDEPSYVSVGKYQLIVIASATGYQSVSTEVGEVWIKPDALAAIDYSLWLDGDALPSGNNIPYGEGPLVAKINNEDQTVEESYHAKIYQIDDNQNETWSKSYYWDETTRSIELDMSNDTGALRPDTYKLIISVSAQDYDTVSTDPIDITVTSDFQMEGGVITGYMGSVTEIEIPSKDYNGNVNTTIGEGAFKESLLTKVIVPEGITTIESKAFANSSLQEISLPRSLTSIAEDAFEGCGQFNVITPVGSYAYRWCLDHGYIKKPDPTPVGYFTYETINGLYARITGYTGTDTVVVIPEEIDGYVIQKISDNAFKNNKTIEYVFIPNTVNAIGAAAFYGCTALIGVDVGQSVEAILSNAFYGCTSLVGIDFPESLTTTGSGIFRNCINLEYFDYPINWQEAGSYTIAGCNRISELIIPEGASIVPSNSFRYCNNITSIEISGTIETIESYAFGACNSLTMVEIPGNVVIVNGFQNCVNLTNVILNEGIKEIGASAFSGCTAITTLDLPDGLEAIGYSAFNGCTCLQSALLPDSVITIGSNAYENCRNLTQFKYPLNLRGITSYAFNAYRVFKGCQKLQSITVPAGVTVIPANAFNGADYLKYVYLPDGLIEIGENAFKDCTAITTLDLPDGLEVIGPYAFNGCTYLQSALLPDSVTKIGTNAYEDCKNLTQFKYPVNLRVVTTTTFNAYRVFKGCQKLESITVPTGVTVIPANIFNGADYLKHVYLPDGLIEIGENAFKDCTAITTLDLPDGLEVIGPYAFNGCTYLQSALLPDSVTKIGTNAYEDCKNLTQFKYPVNLRAVTTTTFNAYRVFRGCEKLESITVPAGVTVIPANIFNGADCLKNVNLPETVSQIGNNAFSGCSILEKVYLGYNVSSIGTNAFKNCPALTIWTEYGAYALQYAKDHSISYYYLSMNGATYPAGTQYKGDAFDFYGYVRSNYGVSTLTASIFSVSQQRNVFSVNLTPRVEECNLYELINPSLLVGQLELGEYTYTIGASTSLDTETFVVSSFTIVPQPIRIYDGGIVAPNGYLSVGDSFTLAGSIESNYVITRAIVEILNSANTTVSTYTATPNSKTFDVSNANGILSFASLSDGDYIFRIRITTNGEISTAFESRFTVLSPEAQASLATNFDAVFKMTSMAEYGVLRKNSMMMSEAAYEEDAAKRCLRTLGFKDIKTYRYNSGTDTCGHVIGWKDINNNGSSIRAFAVICRGTHSGVEWQSNFRVINSGTYHYGFYTAASDVSRNVEAYVANHSGSGTSISDCKVWVTGHSRGAAVANLVAGLFMPKIGFLQKNIYGYTFACPNVSLEELPKCKNIYNYNLGGDLVPRVPLSQWGYSRYGIDRIEHNGEYIEGFSVIDENSMNEFSDTLGSVSREDQIAFMQAIQKSLEDQGVTGSMTNGIFVLTALYKAMAVQSARFIQNPIRWTIGMGNIAEIVKDIYNTHNPNTYWWWIYSMD